MKRNVVLDFLGIDSQKISFSESIISGLGGFLGIAAVYLVSKIFISDEIATFFVVASMGSSAVVHILCTNHKESRKFTMNKITSNISSAVETLEGSGAKVKRLFPIRADLMNSDPFVLWMLFLNKRKIMRGK